MSSQISELIHQWGDGDREALKKFLPLIYNDLRRRARFLLKNERSDISWQGTELVHELYFDLAKLPPMKWNRGQFFAFAVNRMRLILVDHARQRSRKKRGGSTITISLDGTEDGAAGKELDLDVVALHDALGALAETNPNVETAARSTPKYINKIGLLGNTRHSCEGWLRGMDLNHRSRFSGIRSFQRPKFFESSPVLAKNPWPPFCLFSSISRFRADL